MIQDTLPYLIELIRQNVILHALVVSGSWSGIKLDKFDHYVMGQALHVKSFPLSKNDTFDVDFFVRPDLGGGPKDRITTLILTTNESRYFENSSFYFNDDENRGKNKHPIIKEARKKKKDLGVFTIFDDPAKPAFVSIVRNASYGYGIIIIFYTDFDSAYKRKKDVDDGFEAGADSFHFP